MSSPPLKVYSPAGRYRASFVCLSEALLFIAVMGDGWSVRDGHRKKDTCFTIGKDTPHPLESIDGALDVAMVNILT